MQKINTFLWFDSNAEEAVELYISIFKDARRTTALIASDVGPWKPGDIATLNFELFGQEFIAMNGGPNHPFTDAVSLSVSCADQAEIDHYWAAFLESGGEEIACGWLKDRFGLRWQIVPHNIAQLLSHPAAMRAMMSMKKMIVADLEAAAH